jgi:hypothetical protein
MIAMVAVVLAAGMTQAAALSWGSGSSAQGFNDPFGNSFGNSTAYTATLLVWTDGTATTPVNVGSGAQVIDDTASLGAFGGLSANVYGQNVNVKDYAQMVIVSDDGKWMRTSNLRELGTTPVTGNLNINFATGAGFEGGTLGGSLWAGTSWVPIPEPTSLALLGIGAAVVGLRRKLRRK